MEVVTQLPRPTDPIALSRLVDAQRILCATIVSEEDCEQAQALLDELVKPVDEGGFGYFPALLTLASLYAAGFEPAIAKDEARASKYYLRLLKHEKAAEGLSVDLLDDAAMQLSTLVKSCGAKLGEEEQRQLEDLSRGEAAGAVGKVSTWARFAAAEVERARSEANEDPATKQKRLAKEAAREALREREREVAKAALAHADEFRQAGNTACTQGQLPGNARAQEYLGQAVELYRDAIEVLSVGLGKLTQVPEEIAEIHRQRGILRSNAAQVAVTLQDWDQARQLAEQALEDDPENAKSRYRLAKAHTGLGDWEAAAKVVDESLKLLKGAGAEGHTMRSEFWHLAEAVSKSLPSWQWSCAKPEAKETEEDYEKRLVGKWNYPGGVFQIKLENWGALIFCEETVNIDLMRKSKLRWQGELELISGMILKVAYEPGSDVLITEFIPPPDMPEEHRWKGPQKFTATRVVEAKPEEPEPVAPDEAVIEDPALPLASAPLAPEAAISPEQPEEESEETILAGVPEELWLYGNDEFSGRYELLRDRIHNGRPVYRCDGGSERFLWYRGGNWGVTSSLSSSSFAAPFLARSPDNADRARHPLELRRPRWQVRRGRGKEEVDPNLRLQATSGLASASPGESFQGGSGGASSTPKEVAAIAALPTALEMRGRTGLHVEANGRYELTGPSAWGGRPVYRQVEQEGDQPFSIFCDHGFWVLARDVCSLPRATARCRALNSAHPVAVVGAQWEFLMEEVSRGKLITTETRTYSIDRSVRLVRADSGVPVDAGTEPATSQREDAPGGLIDVGAEPTTPKREDAAAAPPPVLEPIRPAWVGAASADLDGGEIRAAVVAKDGVVVDMSSLCLDLAPTILKVSLSGYEDLELPLPSTVDAECHPAARWSEKTRTLKVRLALLCGA